MYILDVCLYGSVVHRYLHVPARPVPTRLLSDLAPAARRIDRGRERPWRLEHVEALLASKALIIDACRYVVRQRQAVVSLLGRPVLFALARVLAEAWPQEASRDVPIARAFGGRHSDESHSALPAVETRRQRASVWLLAGSRPTPHCRSLQTHTS